MNDQKPLKEIFIYTIRLIGNSQPLCIQLSYWTGFIEQFIYRMDLALLFKNVFHNLFDNSKQSKTALVR